MCQSLREFIQQEGLHTIEEGYGAALPFLATEYERFMRNRRERLFRLEYKSNRFSKENKNLDQILPEVGATLEPLAATQEEIGGPFSFASITSKGFEKVG